MKRRVVLHGPSTLTVSLPSEWTRKRGIKKGDEVNVDETDEGLIISGHDQKQKKKRAEIDISGMDNRTAGNILSLLYKKGYDEISVKYSDLNSAKEIEENTKNHLLGFTILGQSKNSCLIKCVSEEIKEEFDKSLKRAFQVTLSLAESSLQYIREKNYSHLKDLFLLEVSNNQLTNFCERLLNKHFIGQKNVTFKYVIVWQLEKIADGYKEILKLLDDTEINNCILDLYEKANTLFREYYDAYYNADLKKLQNILDNRKEVNKEIKDLKMKDSDEVLLISYLLHIIFTITELIPSTIAVIGAFEDGTGI